MSSQQLPLNFHFLALPEPEVTKDRIRDGDVEIGDDALAVPGLLTHGKAVLEAIEQLGGYVLLNELIYAPVTAGYTDIEKRIRARHSLVPKHSGIQITVRQLLRLGFLKLHMPPEFYSCAQYQALTKPGMLAMLRGVNATHFRIYRNQVLLIAAVHGRPCVI
jgi:hypothetical protein